VVGAGTRILGRGCRGRGGENSGGVTRQSGSGGAMRKSSSSWAGGIGRRGQSTLLS
jgi:hypothetical protein